MVSKLMEHIFSGDFSSAEVLMESMSENEIVNALISETYENESLTSVGFALHMKEKTQKIIWLDTAIKLLINPLAFLEGAYTWALYFAREVLELERNEKNLEQILFFYTIPDKLISKEEALMVAKEILKMNPLSQIAQKCIDGDI